MMGLVAATGAFSEAALTALVGGAILAGAPLMFAALGELVSQRAGVLNIGLEGMMLIGAYAGFVAAYHGGSEWYGFAAGMAAGAGVSLLMVLFCVRWGLDQIVIGIGITLLCEGATALIFEAEFAESRPTLGAVDKVAIPGASEIPIVGGGGESDGSVFTQPLVVYLGLGLAVLLAWMLRRTHMGLNVRAAGDAPGALDAAGVSVFATRSFAVLFAGAMAGLGGAFLSIVSAGLFQDTVVGGRGFIAIVLAMLARGRPFWAVAGALLFGASLAIADWAQVANFYFGLPSSTFTDTVFMLPFVLVLIVLVVFGRRAYLPAALALPYERGTR
jgi:general nucleoside transport system permease protein